MTKQEASIAMKAIATALRPILNDFETRLQAVEFRSEKASQITPLGERVKGLEEKFASGRERDDEVRDLRKQNQNLSDLILECRKQLEAHRRHLQNLESKFKARGF